MKATLEEISDRNLAEANHYLSAHEDSAQFLINNLREQGPCLTDHPNSGNFRLVREGGRVKAAFCLSRRGNLLVQADADFSSLILEACRKEPLALRGFIGDWDSVAPIWQRFQAENPAFQPTYESQEILYSYELLPGDAQLQHDPRVRFLREADFPQWLEFTRDYMQELLLPDDLTDEQKKANFHRQVKDRVWWGLFDGEQMLSRVALNSKGAGVGQVGGVFTPRPFRKQGLATAAMLHMLKDCRDLHQHRKSILFTGQADMPAQMLYESMGYRRIGFFALILS